ncbi:hypothetical protein GC093_01030 [Paenibacillus sp. LMG 31456]|uniref:Lipoprotein n=1 Tax=Paenibacillus foliorum TaxID=2654974 RepID=A0A972K0L5_9BACL|nr:hypothetical protein [Paenibacillus foliorum]NOU91822.1 hypothetical protein [Paenibacillus foliorum]
MKKQIIILMLSLTTAVTGLTACTKKIDKVGSSPAVLNGQSQHWKVELEYVANGDALDEIISMQTSITEQTMSEVTATIYHKDQEPKSLPVTEPELFKTGQALTFVDKGSVKNWKDTEQVAVEWKIGDTRVKEYVTVANKSASSSTK